MQSSTKKRCLWKNTLEKNLNGEGTDFNPGNIGPKRKVYNCCNWDGYNISCPKNPEFYNQ